MGEQNDFENQFGNCPDIRRAIGAPLGRKVKPKKTKNPKAAKKAAKK